MATAAALESTQVEDRSRIEEEWPYEIVDGQRVELPPMSAYEGRIASRLVTRMNEFAEPQGLGEAVSEVLFHLALPVDRNRRPDVAFVSYERWPKHRPQPRKDAWDVVPDLAVEVASAHELIEELLTKIDEYFRSGVRQVWVIHPRWRLLYIYDSWTSVRVLTASDELDGGGVLPGFKLPLATLFPESTND